mmetsp:Transcript_11962/g.50338  ORF Transcript_11962/g.50338 Transcript_11962/m.50338 type:complete len:231 (+) Transcript_11962:2460-3152(+)
MGMLAHACLGCSRSPPRRLHADALLGLLDQVQRDQSNHCVRGDADIIGGEAGPELERTALSDSLGEAVSHALVRHGPVGERLLLLQLCLDEVKGQRHERGEEAGDGRRAQRALHAGDTGVGEHLLGLVVRRKHAHVEGHRAHGGGARTREQAADALLLDRAHERVADVLVVAALLWRQGAVRLHADERQIGGRADHGTKAARGEASERLLVQRQRLAVVALLELVADGGE